MPETTKGVKVSGVQSWSYFGKPDYVPMAFNGTAAKRLEQEGIKGVPHRTAGHWTNPAEHEGTKMGGGWWHDTTNNIVRKCGSGSKKRKEASAMIAKIPLSLARHIAAVHRPV